ncbi:hypothetical protein FKW77_000556 [Venturia effusa]|uniref:Uncharacterized protein n=1 Tax=Venturia effusa TaxID=50376 RepID=A0A517LRI0_9PEZI|nr:hypothetical protein FKW77_000556 [Venturia effusa]
MASYIVTNVIHKVLTGQIELKNNGRTHQARVMVDKGIAGLTIEKASSQDHKLHFVKRMSAELIKKIEEVEDKLRNQWGCQLTRLADENEALRKLSGLLLFDPIPRMPAIIELNRCAPKATTDSREAITSL